ncbi:MAG TPA: hypothetical protein PKD64_09550 [Pirellulaceae bacterium]|nr:hypothetical protein [Pirellulaceae bacterium]HMO92431.1 hypothetical protein [Pirellulaceae bacterium]HMP67899.1 hypothetical protein [Pirellulaceae bacterium]
MVQSELKRLIGEIKSLGPSIQGIESRAAPNRTIELNEVTATLQQLDPVWEVLYPEERRRVLELLIKSITVTKSTVNIHFRPNGIEQIVDELTPISEQRDG